jgi:peptide/nickel transport system substrate-binding protein
MKNSLGKSVRICGLALALASSVSLIGLGSGVVATSASASSANKSATVTYALPASVTPNYIFPIMGAAVYSNVNLYQFQQLMFRPLYWFGQGTKPSFNESLSLALAPVYSNGGKTMTIKLKKYNWSDGKPVTANDIIFFMNMLKAEKSIWPIYVVNEFPDNVTAMSTPNPSTVVFTLDKTYSSNWFLYNELSQITPLPQHAWDKESATGKIGKYDSTTTGAKAVFNYLTAQAKIPTAYATNPLWKIVDGPFKLQSYQTTGYTAFVPNAKYSGAVKAKYAKLVLEPFTTDTAEFNSLRAGAVNYGYVPPQDAAQISLLKTQGYTSSPWIGWGINYFSENFNNPTVGPIFRQLYFRQAFQEMVNQPQNVKKALYGYGYPTYGPVPIKPANNFASPQEANNPYPFSPSNSAKLLKSHGWNVKPGGISTCAKPGTGASECGAGIPKGRKLIFNLQYISGLTYVAVEMAQLKTNLALDGAQLNLTTAPFDTILSNMVACPVGPTCTWQFENWGQGWSYGPDYYPTGESIFATGVGMNGGSYTNATNDANINATHVISGTAVLYKYENYLTKQLPDVWQANPDFQISEISTKLKGVTQSPILNFTPEFWTLTN